MPGRQRQVLQRILRCRTPALGGQLFACSDCGAHHFRYHSCNDRHCPLCGQTDAEQWLACRESRLLLPTNHLFYQALQKHDPQALASLPGKVWTQRWVVHSQPVGSGQQALHYLSRYIFKTATGNRPLELLSDGRVRWPYRNSASGQPAYQDFTPEELLRRFLQHILPCGYHRVRLFGWFHPASGQKLNRVRALLKQAPVLTQAQREAWQLGEESFWRLSNPSASNRRPRPNVRIAKS
jgi:hypothetical protein